MKNSILTEIFIWTVVLAILFTGIIFAYSKIFVEPNVYTIEFKDIDGITKGSPVRFMGITVGHVRKLKSKNEHINVQIIITSKDMKIPNGTIARVEFWGLGGSKSIELMPPDGSCDIGIITGDTIRLADVAKETGGLVELIEILDRYVKSLDKAGMTRVLNTISDIKDDSIIKAGNEINAFGKEIADKAQSIKYKQKEITDKIKNIDLNVEKINTFIKK